MGADLNETTYRRGQRGWGLSTRLSMTYLKWYWYLYSCSRFNMHLCFDAYAMVQSWCIWYGAVNCCDVMHKFYNTGSFNTCFVPSSFSGLSKNVLYQDQLRKDSLTRQITKILTRGGRVGFRDDNSTISWKVQVWKAELTNLDWDLDENMKSVIGTILTKKWIESSIIIGDSWVGNRFCIHKNMPRYIIVEGR
jgi:hypothetical protein